MALIKTLVSSDFVILLVLSISRQETRGGANLYLRYTGQAAGVF
jgi:hypothetical protein